jgi:Fe-S cluster assembly protein SufB
MTDRAPAAGVDLPGAYHLGWRDAIRYAEVAGEGLDEALVRRISAAKRERPGLLRWRLEALESFRSTGLADWAAGEWTGQLDLSRLRLFARPMGTGAGDWRAMPASMRSTFERLGVADAERDALDGVNAQYDSEVVYHHHRAELDRSGVVFTPMETAVREHWDLVEPALGTVVPAGDNPGASLNAAVWSGGSFVYVPAGVHVERPLQGYFRVNAERFGQFERSLVVVEEGAFVHYVDACSAARYATPSLHAGVLEVIVRPGARCRISGIQDWPTNVFNLPTKRARAGRGATVEWVEANLGARLTMAYPGTVLAGEGAHGSSLSIGYAGAGQHQDTGAEMFHLGPGTTSTVVSKSICRGGGISSYRGVVHVGHGAAGARSFVQCDSLILDEGSRSDTHPRIEVEQAGARVGHEASVTRIDEGRLIYLMSRGLDQEQAEALIVAGFIEPVSRELPMACAEAVNRLIGLDMAAAGSVG